MTPKSVKESVGNAFDASLILGKVIAFYHRALGRDAAAIQYLSAHKLGEAKLWEVFSMGYSNGALLNALPKSGAAELIKTGILNQDGQERFLGCVVVPVYDPTGRVIQMVGRRISDGVEVLLNQDYSFVFNSVCAKADKSLFAVETVFDVLSLWQSGFKNVVGFCGKDHDLFDKFVQENGVLEVTLGFSATEGAQVLREKIGRRVEKVETIKWPEGIAGATGYFQGHGLLDFEKLIIQSQTKAQNQPTDGETKTSENGMVFERGKRFYQLCAIEKPGATRLRATVKATVEKSGKFHLDTIEFYSSRSRHAFIGEAAQLFGEKASIIAEDINQLLIYLEKFAGAKIEEPLVMTEADRESGMALGRHPDLVGEILGDMEKLGSIGERINKLIGYLVMTSRKTDYPLALQFLSGSGAGKSHLQDSILSLCPEEELVKVTSLTEQALFYKGENSLKHKVLAVEEGAGAVGARYAIRNLISARKLVIESAVRNGATGRLETQLNTVNGPTAIFETTTNPHTDAETKSRFIIASIDESPEQTRAILQAQRNAHTLEGLLRYRQGEKIRNRHRAFQRLLKPLVVLNPFEPELSYQEERMMGRRDHPKYLHLILVITFLHQMQRPMKHHPEIGDYIETTREDIALADEIAAGLFGWDELSRPSRRLLELLTQYVSEKGQRLEIAKSEVEFSRREVREAFGWSEYQMRTHLKELVQMEYVVPVSGRHGQLYRYLLVNEQLRGEKPNFEGTSGNGTHEVVEVATLSLPIKSEKRKATSRVGGGNL